MNFESSLSAAGPPMFRPCRLFMKCVAWKISILCNPFNCFRFTWVQSPKKVNLVVEFVRGMCVEDALLQLQVKVKPAVKTVYQVIRLF